MELGGEDGAGFVDHAFVGRVVEVDKVFFVIRVESGGINCIPVVLGGYLKTVSGNILVGKRDLGQGLRGSDQW